MSSGQRAHDAGEPVRLAGVPVRRRHIDRLNGPPYRRMAAAGLRHAYRQDLASVAAPPVGAVRAAGSPADRAASVPGALLLAAGVRLGADGGVVASGHCPDHGLATSRSLVATTAGRG